MPLYDYRCEACGAFRAFRPMAESTQDTPCPRCDRPAARLLTAPMLAGAPPGWLGGGPPGAAGGGWRKACGFGCGHPGCG